MTPEGRLVITQNVANTNSIRLADLGVLDGSFATPALCISEHDRLAHIPITLEAAAVNSRTLTYTISGGTADSNDYTLPTSGTITFAPGQRTMVLPVPIADDAQPENAETLMLTLAGEPSSIHLTQASHTLTI